MLEVILQTSECLQKVLQKLVAAVSSLFLHKLLADRRLILLVVIYCLFSIYDHIFAFCCSDMSHVSETFFLYEAGQISVVWMKAI